MPLDQPSAGSVIELISAGQVLPPWTVIWVPPKGLGAMVTVAGSIMGSKVRPRHFKCAVWQLGPHNQSTHPSWTPLVIAFAGARLAAASSAIDARLITVHEGVVAGTRLVIRPHSRECCWGCPGIPTVLRPSPHNPGTPAVSQPQSMPISPASCLRPHWR